MYQQNKSAQLGSKITLTDPYSAWINTSFNNLHAG